MKLKLFLMATLLLAILIILLNFSRPILTERVQDIAVHQSSSVERYFIENVWRENLNKLTYDLAMHLRSDRVLMQSIQDLANDASASELQNRVFNRLTYHLNTGFFTGGYVQPMHLAAYDAEFNPLVMHLQDVDSLHLARPLSVEYVQRLKARSNVEAMQVFDLLEVQEDGTVYYSVMIPVGLYKAEAYLELRINPIYNLKKLESFGLPIQISSSNKVVYQSEMWSENDTLANVKIDLFTDFRRPALKISTQRDFGALQQDIQLFMKDVATYLLSILLMIVLYLFWMIQQAIKPIEQVNNMMNHVAKGYFSRRFMIQGRDEVSRAQEEFNAAMDKIQASIERLTQALNGESVDFEGEYSHKGELGLLEQQVTRVLNLQEQLRRALQKSEQTDLLVQQSRHAMMGEMLAMISHQWKQPLTTLIMNEDLVRLKLSQVQMEDEKRAFLNRRIELNKELLRELDQTISDFRDFFRPDKEKSYFDVYQQVYSLLQMFEGLLIQSSIEVDVKGIQALVYGYEREMRQVMSNLIKNAIDQLKEEGIENPVIKIEISEAPESFIVQVSDNGGGILESVLPTVFDAYVSTKSMNGTGLGLYMCKTIVEDHFKGQLSAFNQAEGACFKINLPK